LITAGIALAIIAVVNGLGTKLNTKFTSINSSLKQPAGPAIGPSTRIGAASNGGLFIAERMFRQRSQS
jgi:hypothetical protein